MPRRTLHRFTIMVEEMDHAGIKAGRFPRVFTPPNRDESMSLADCFYPTLDDALSDMVSVALAPGEDVEVRIQSVPTHVLVTEVLQVFPHAEPGILTEGELA